MLSRRPTMTSGAAPGSDGRHRVGLGPVTTSVVPGSGHPTRSGNGNRAAARFLKPSAGLEPATPSLPWKPGTQRAGCGGLRSFASAGIFGVSGCACVSACRRTWDGVGRAMDAQRLLSTRPKAATDGRPPAPDALLCQSGATRICNLRPPAPSRNVPAAMTPRTTNRILRIGALLVDLRLVAEPGFLAAHAQRVAVAADAECVVNQVRATGEGDRCGQGRVSGCPPVDPLPCISAISSGPSSPRTERAAGSGPTEGGPGSARCDQRAHQPPARVPRRSQPRCEPRCPTDQAPPVPPTSAPDQRRRRRCRRSRRSP